jgi:hypothetical protein
MIRLLLHAGVFMVLALSSCAGARPSAVDPNLVIMALDSPEQVFFMRDKGRLVVAFHSGDWIIDDVQVRRKDGTAQGRMIRRDDDLVVIEMEEQNIDDCYLFYTETRKPAEDGLRTRRGGGIASKKWQLLKLCP